MLKHFSNLFWLFVLMLLLNVNLFSQQCKVITTNVKFESANSLTFDVYVENNGATNWTYSHGSYVWNYDTAFLNGGTPTFTLVTGYSAFPTSAQPPSALITSPDILRTSSNMPGSNGVILAGQSLRLYRFRLQTSASSFNGSYFNITWKNTGTPATKIYGWDSGSGLPAEIGTVNLSIQQLLFEENFDYTENDTLNGLNGWIVQPTASYVNPIRVVSPGLTYTGYPSNIGNAAKVDTTGQDLYHTFTSQNSGSVYASCLVNFSKVTATGDYFLHFTESAGSTTFKARVFAKLSGSEISFGLMKGSSIAATYTTSTYALNTTHLVVIKYKFNTTSSTDDSVYLYINPVVSSNEPTPDLSVGNTDADFVSCSAINLRQGTAANAPRLILDGIRVGTAWSDIFPGSAGEPLIQVSPQTLSGFNYNVGGGPSASQSYNVVGSDLIPASSSILVTGSTNYEVSLNNTTFSSSVSISYTGGSLSTTPVYVRLKAGLPGGIYNGETISNAGGGATTKLVTCNGSVAKLEPTNHVTNFTGALGLPAYYYVNLTWTDATGGVTPDGYLIRASAISFDSIQVPVDGTPVANSTLNQNTAYGIQSQLFTGLAANTTYYFKIFPYSNSGSTIDYKTNGTVPQFSITTGSLPDLPITENFEYTTGSNLTANGWIAHSGAGTNPIQVGASSLTYTGYVNSGLGKSVTLTTTGEDVNRSFVNVTENSLYASFMINVASAQTAGDYVFHFAPENSTSLFYSKLFIKKNAGDSLAFGVAKNVNGSVSYTPFNYSLNTTYLVVLKYTFNTGGTTDDEAKLWINPVLNGTEPPADVTITDAGTDALSLGMFALRQGTSTSAPAVTIAGIRVATTWVPASSGSNTFQLSVTVANGWNMVSIPGLHPTDQNVNTWWNFRDPLASVYKWSGGSYSPVTTATPTEGYWLLHSGARTYNTGDEWPAGGIQLVNHDPIAVTSGWNMIGGYDNSASVSGLTTTPPGLIVPGTVYGWNGGYYNPTNLEPGYGYWILLTGSGVINPPTALKGGSTAKETNTEGWGKIIVTDASGKSYTLYSVKGEVNLMEYQLPPLPPAGLFDVRFGSGRKAEDLKTSQTIEMQGLVYPIVVKSENMDIRLQDVSGTVVNQSLKSGESVTISNSSVSKLMVSATVIPDKYSLEQNYPNPFNPSTVISFSLPEDASNVRLTIYDALGQKVAELVNGKLEAGKYQYTWNAGNNATGLYIYELRTDKFVSVKKMLMVK